MFKNSLAVGALFSVALFAHAALGYDVQNLDSTQLLSERAVNRTDSEACEAIHAFNRTSDRSSLWFLPYTTGNEHYMVSSNQASSCVYTPYHAEDLGAAIRVIGERRASFAVSCSGHASNRGFSSTRGVHISMHGFKHVKVSADKSYVDVGGGISWAEVYKKLDGTGVNVVGGRVPGPGIGGFVTGGGGFSWLTNQAGLTGDTLISVKMVLPNGTLTTASQDHNPDLFWAIKGGGNQFGVIYSFRLKAFPLPRAVYAGMKFYTGDELPAVMDAIYDFAEHNNNSKAQVIPTLNYILDTPGAVLIAYYDGVPDNDPFSMFNTTFENQTFNSFIQSLGVDELEANQRGAFHTVSLQRYSKPVLAQIYNQTKFYGAHSLAHSGTFISYDVEPFLPYARYAKDAAWPHASNALPLNLYFAWRGASHDAFWHNAMRESAAMITETAKQDGQNLDDLYLYPNYALDSTPVEAMYGSNVPKIRELQRKYDPDQVMSLTTYFQF